MSINDIQFGNLYQLNWLWLIPLCSATALFAIMVTRRARKRFASTNLIPRVLPSTHSRTIISMVLISMAIAMMVFALIDIRWGKVWREVPQKGIEVMFVLDVSRSMLAEDTTPNRLSRAKQQIEDVLDAMSGDRVGLVVFAGDARQQIPMTNHYDGFRQSLASVGPHSVQRGGSRLGDAIELASEAFLSKTNDHKAMVILTDGEDQESKPAVAAQRAFTDKGVRIFTIGLGDMTQGARIPIRSGQHSQSSYVQYEGEQVWSKQNGETLQKIAAMTRGAYIPAGTKRVNMSDVYHGYIASIEQQEFETAKLNSYEARFQWFLAPALFMLLAEVMITTWPRRRGRGRGRVGAIGTQHTEFKRQPEDSARVAV